MVQVENPTGNLAFLVHLKLMKYVHDPEEDDSRQMEEVLPALWQDNYLPLLPGEKRQIEVDYNNNEGNPPAMVTVDGWNVEPASVTLPGR